MSAFDSLSIATEGYITLSCVYSGAEIGGGLTVGGALTAQTAVSTEVDATAIATDGYLRAACAVVFGELDAQPAVFSSTGATIYAAPELSAAPWLYH